MLSASVSAVLWGRCEAGIQGSYFQTFAETNCGGKNSLRQCYTRSSTDRLYTALYGIIWFNFHVTNLGAG